MVPSRVVPGGAAARSSSSSGILFEGDGHAQVAGNSRLSSNFGNSWSSFPGHAPVNTGLLSGDVSNTVIHSVASSGPSVGASSLVTDANSGLSGGPHLQRSASVNTESYMRLPASPMSFSSNNISLSGSSVMDGSSVVQQSSNHDPGSQHAHRNQHLQGLSSATSLLHTGQVQFPGGARVPNSFVQDPTTMPQPLQKPLLDIKQEDIVHQPVLLQLLQRQTSMHLQNSNPQLQALIQHMLRQQELQPLQDMTSLQVQRAQLLQQQQQLRKQSQMQEMPSATSVKRPYDGGVCTRRLMQYLYHQRQRPDDNAIAYWRKFVAEYYSPRAKMRLCLSLHDNAGHQPLGVFPQAAMDAWQCDICGSKSGRGFEAAFEVLPRLYEIKFASGVIDELLFLDLPREIRFPSGILMLECAKAVQESVFEQFRVVHEGQLRVFFTPDLKILSWELCVQRHEELLSRKFVAPQVNQLLQVAQKCHSTISECGAGGISQSDLQANSAMVVTSGRQLARSLELQSLNDLGFSKRYVRCLQIADVVNSMKDLMDFCRDQKKGPKEGLKSFWRCAAAPRETDKIGLQGLPTDRKTLNKLMALHPGLNSQINRQHAGGQGGALAGSAHAALAMTNYQNLLMRQNPMNSTNSLNQHEGSYTFNTSNQPMSTSPGSSGAFPGMLQNPPISHQQKLQLQPPNGNALTQENQSLKHQMIHQLIHDMSKKNNGEAVMQQISVQNPGNYLSGIRNSATGSGPAVAQAQPPSRSNSFRATLVPPAPVGHLGFDQTASYFPENLHSSSDEMLPDIAHQFIENGFFNNDLDESMNFSWME